MNDFLTGVWSLRYVFLFVAFLTATAFALEYRRKWHDAAGLVGVLAEQLRIADRRDMEREARGAVAAAAADITGEDPVFEQGYVYDRIPAWVPADVPGSPQEPRRVPR